ncbi:hypothetical protein ACH5RR_018209 [Cinchona calisaya]|uniref:Uncharacterized protein n=1 Tax=Cinchona calisaya TaxID=153742 RepID=A0ABD2ZNY6_9GENT
MHKGCSGNKTCNFRIFEGVCTKRTNYEKRSYDPTDYESIDKTEFWEVEKEPNGELDYEELEVELEELPVDVDIECSNSQQVEGLV